MRQCVHEIILLNQFEPKYFDVRWKACDMVTCCPDVGIYKNPKITEHLEINDVQFLRTDETMIESYEETISVTKDNDESEKEILTQTSLLSPIDDGTYNQNDDDEYNSSKNEEMLYNDMMSVHQNSILHYKGIKNIK